VPLLDYLPGIRSTDRPALRGAASIRAAVAEKGRPSYLQQLGALSASFTPIPIPANLAGGRRMEALIYYDFGMMGQISHGLRSDWAHVRAAAAADASAWLVELQGAG